MKDIKIIVLDVDGTLTDGKIYYDNLGNEMKAFNIKDGMAIVQAIKNDILFAIITGRKSDIVKKRGDELGINHIYQGVNNKLQVLNKLLLELNLENDNVMYIGDDINDLEIIRSVKYSACPADAANEVINVCTFVSKFTGGNGAVREIVERVLKVQNKWERIVQNYFGVNQ